MKSISLDAGDLQLLAQLQRDASLSNLELATRVHMSAPTSLRRVKRLQEAGIIERQVALLSPERLAEVLGFGLTVVVEVTLERQDSATLEAFEAKVVADGAVQQCYRVSPGPDFILVVQVRDMPRYQALAQRLFNTDSQVRNVKSFFNLKRAKFGAELPLDL